MVTFIDIQCILYVLSRISYRSFVKGGTINHPKHTAPQGVRGMLSHEFVYIRPYVVATGACN